MTTYEVRVVLPLTDDTTDHATTEADALAAAERLVNRPRVEQVTIEATPDSRALDTFAVRHVKPTPCPHDCKRFGGKVPGHLRGSNWEWVPCWCDGTGVIADTGEWSCWVEGMFTGHRPTLDGWPT